MPLGLSKKCSAIAPSATLAMDARAKELRSQGVNVIGFAAGEPDFETPVPIREAMKEAMDLGMTRYTPVAGTLELRRAIAENAGRDAIRMLLERADFATLSASVIKLVHDGVTTVEEATRTINTLE